MTAVRPMRVPPDVGTVAAMTRGPLVDRLRGLDQRVFDVLLAIGVTVLCVGSQFAESEANDELYRDTDALAVTFGLAATLPMFWRRRHPLPALVTSGVAVSLLAILEYRTNSVPTAALFLSYAAGAYSTRRQALVGLVVINASLLAILVSDAPDFDVSAALLNAAVYSGAWLAGQATQARAAAGAARLAEAEERAEAQRQVAARAIAEERLRLAQELHDAVAHSMSVIAVQAGMGVHVIDSRPDDAKQALVAISATSRGTLQEMRRLLGVLRGEDGERSHGPAPGLADLPALVEDVRSAGVPVAFTVEGDAATVPHGIGMSVYRLVQEGLTNVIKHAGRASAAVTVRCEPGEVVVEVVDDGRGAAVNGAATDGHGLVGMRERVGLWGGTLDAGPRPGGGFRVLARVPYGDLA